MKKIKVLHLPYNVSSAASITVSELNKRDDVIARGCIFSDKHLYTSEEGITYYPTPKSVFSFRFFSTLFFLIRNFFWADIIHWYWGPFMPHTADLRLLRLFRKKIIIQWHGSDIRIPEIVMEDNPYYRKVYESKLYEYSHLESQAQSRSRQELFSKLKAVPVVYQELVPFLQKGLFEQYFVIKHRIDIRKFKPAFPDPLKTLPHVVHVSSQHYTKGTDKVIELLEELSQSKSCTYKVITNETREAVLKQVSECDIFLDQFIIGEYGLASVEAMAFGKPVISYIRPQNIQTLPSNFPMIIASLDELRGALTDLVKNPQKRTELGQKSREYAQKNHDSALVVNQLVEVYKKNLNRS
jgi:glycosyltransferase involved in cell wall biosynthesis